MISKQVIILFINHKKKQAGVEMGYTGGWDIYTAVWNIGRLQILRRVQSNMNPKP